MGVNRQLTLMEDLFAVENRPVMLRETINKARLGLKHEQVRPSSGTALYPHMPILRPHAAWYSTTVASLSDESGSARAPRIRPIWGFWGCEVHKNLSFPALVADEPPC